MIKPAFDMGLDGPANLQEFFTSKYRDLPLGPRFGLGHGLSYMTFEYTGAALSRTTISLAELDAGEEVEAGATVINTGARDDKDVVLLFTRDVLASLAPAVRRLAGFRRVSLAAGGSARVVFRLGRRHLALAAIAATATASLATGFAGLVLTMITSELRLFHIIGVSPLVRWEFR